MRICGVQTQINSDVENYCCKACQTGILLRASGKVVGRCYRANSTLHHAKNSTLVLLAVVHTFQRFDVVSGRDFVCSSIRVEFD